MNKFFDIVVCLTQEKRHDRRIMFEEECREAGIKSELFYSLPNQDSKVSFCLSQKAMLEWCLKQKGDTFLCLEDDVKFQNLEKFQQVIKELPEDWTMVYFGANAKPYPEFQQAEKFSEHLRVLRSAWCTHAIGYKRELIEEIVDRYEYQVGQMFDTWLDLTILKERPVFITVPFLAVQKPVRSDLWNTCVDYKDTWTGSEDYLRSC